MTWEDIYKKKGEVQKRIHPLVEKAVPLFKENGVEKILDVGCGTGRHAVFLAELGFQVTGIDVSEKGIELLRAKLDEKKLEGIELKISDMSSLPFPDGCFDAVVSIYVIYHATRGKLVKTIREMRRVLRKGGLVAVNLISTENPRCGSGKKIEPNTFIGAVGPHKEEADVPHHFSTQEEARELFSGFEIISFVRRIISPETGQKSGFWEIIARK